MNLNTKILNLHGVGKTIAGRLKKLDLLTVGDLLHYFPYRYEDFSVSTDIDKLREGESANVVGTVELMQNRRARNRRMTITEALVANDSGEIKVIWFNQPFIKKNIHVGDTVSLSGKVKNDYGVFSLISPNYEKLVRGQAVHTQGLVPIYHLTANITQKQIRFLIKQVIDAAELLTDWLPVDILARNKLPTLPEAVRGIHFPENSGELEAARRRLAFNELFLLQVRNQLNKQELAAQRGVKIAFKEKGTKQFVDSLPFKLTNAQKRSAWEIIKDLGQKKPMTRLLEGDVGSGKTVVAGLAMYNAALNKAQSVLMAPTEILAVQHYHTLLKLFSDSGIKIALLTRSEKRFMGDKTKPAQLTRAIAGGEVDIIVGTHAAIQEKIIYNNLALAIVDEQHRFGVEQRKALVAKAQKGVTPHLLSMTATPIPRSLALTIFGDLDISIINEMPKGRIPIITQIIPETKRQEAYAFIRNKINEGQQVFVICPLIDISDKLGVKSVKEEFAKLDNNTFPDIPMAMLHGRMKAEEKDSVMRDFLDKKTMILVATSVIEVGVDVPNATVMMIEGADRFGLAQLHQFRGRVGRGALQSYCFLFTDNTAPRTLQRLQFMVKCNNGFDLANFDLKLRGPGEVFGTAQKGFPDLKIAKVTDQELNKTAREEAENLLLKGKISHKPLKNKLDNFYKTAHLE